MFWQNEDFSGGLGTQIRLDSVICVVDSVFGIKVKHNYQVDAIHSHITTANRRR